MQTLAEKLLKAGLVSQEKVDQDRLMREAEALNDRPAPSGDQPTTNDLDACGTMAAFRETAKTLLENDPTTIRTIIEKAHRFKDDADDNAKRFIWFFFQTRDALKKLPREKHKTLLRRAFRRNNPTFNVD